jgi:hypothetical protein
MYIPKSDFGWNRRTGWLHGNEEGYNNLVKLWQNRPKGRERTRPIHPSWEEVLKLFDPNDKERSQGAFCRWAGIDRAAFSAKHCKPIELHIVELIGAWNAQGKEVESE